MTENKKKRKELVKSIAIIFLAVMLALTFFSKTILNWSLPEVSGQYAGYGQITSSVRGKGTVSANMGYSVTINESRVIKEVLIRREDRVEAGQVIFTLEAGDSSELENAKENLYDMENSLKLSKLNASISSTDSIESDISELRSQLSEAKKKLAALEAKGVTEDTLETLKKSIKESEAGIEALNRKLNDVGTGEGMEEYEPVREAQAAYDAAKEADDRERENYSLLTQLQSDIESYQASITANEKKLNQLLVERNEAQESYDYKHPMLLAYRNALLEYSNLMTKLDTFYLTAEQQEADPEGYQETLEELRAAQEYVNAFTDQVGPITKEELEQLEDQVVVFKDEIYYTTQELEEQRAMLAILNPENRELIDVKLDAARSKQAMRETAEALSLAEKALSAAQEQYRQESKSITAELNAQLEAAQDELTALRKQQSEAEETLAELKDAKNTVTSLDKSLTSRQKDLTNAQKQSSVETQRTEIELERQEREVEKQRALVESLTAKQGGTEVKAKYPGTVTTVGVMAGDRVTPDTTLATIGVEEKGYTLTMSVSNEQAARLGIGDKASVKNYWWGNIDVTLSSISVDRAQQGKGKILEFTVNGDVTDGQSLELEIGERSTSYSTVVPNSAVREDSEGKFVLVSEAKSTPLGNRYIAKKVPVTVIDSDNYNSAVDIESEYSYAYIITASTKPIEAGMQVRLAEG